MKSTLPTLLESIKELEKLVRATTTPIRTAFRARIILLAMRGERPSAIAQILKTTLGTIRKWLNRFYQHPVLESLKDAQRSGRPLIIPAIAKCEVIKFACSDARTIIPNAINKCII